MKRIRGAGANARQTSHALLLHHDHGTFLVLPIFGIERQGKECLEGAMRDAKVAPRAVLLHDGHHRLTHGSYMGRASITVCIQSRWVSDCGELLMENMAAGNGDLE